MACFSKGVDVKFLGSSLPYLDIFIFLNIYVN